MLGKNCIYVENIDNIPEVIISIPTTRTMKINYGPDTYLTF